jgi:putative redox protein
MDMSLTATARSTDDTLRAEVLVDGRFALATDEPEHLGGTDTAPAPHELFPAAVAACVLTTMRMYARTKGWEMGDASVDVEYDHTSTPRRFEIAVHLPADLSDEQVRRLTRVAETCPIKRAIEAGIVFEEHVDRVPVAA